MSPTDEREAAAQRYEAAAAHLRWTATHFRDGEASRKCAHTVAALGHMSNVQTQLNGLAALHAAKAQI